jgi:hypothetical protein
MRAKPPGLPIMEQNWEKILFLHWPVEPTTIRPLIPPELEIDTFDNTAWIGITPFELTGLKLHPVPAIPGISSFKEINVRTYVHHNGKPGLYFLSLNASSLLPAWAARVFYHLPYFAAEIEFTGGEASAFQFNCRRSQNPQTRFAAKWTPGMRLRAPDTESLAFFLVERYCFFTQFESSVSMTRVYHPPWILDEAHLESCESTMLAALHLPEPTAAPLAHFSQGVNVQIWPPVSD